MHRKHKLTRAEILTTEEYGKIRTNIRRKLSVRKRNRRVEVGPYVTFYFELFREL
jgi:hypothetical protein